MKTHTIKTPTAELMIVELPIVWDYEPITDDKTFIYHKTEEGTNDHHIEGYTILGKPDEIREEDARELVHKVEGYNPVLKVFHPAYRLYKGTIIRATHTAKESLLSLLESEIYWENPYDKSGMTFANEYENKWQEAEQKTFDRNRTLIFKKNK